jgi:WD40 repeat protein
MRLKCSSAFSLALIPLSLSWLYNPVQAQQPAPNVFSAMADTRARLVVQVGHSDDVSSVAFSSDGKYVVTGSWDDTAVLWEADTGKELRRFRGHSHLESVAFSLDGKFVLTGSIDGTALLWQTETAKEIRGFGEPSSPISSVALSVDGRYALTGGFDNKAKLWEVTTGKPVRQFEGHSGPIHSVAFSSNGEYVLTGSEDKTARLWKTETGRQMGQFVGHSNVIYSVAFSPDGKYVLTGSEDETARLWSAETGKEARRFEGHSQSIYSVAFSPDGRYAVMGSGDRTARVWEVQTGKMLSRFAGNSGQIESVVFSPDGKYIITGSFDGTAYLWDVEMGQHMRRFIGHSGSINSVAVSADGKYLLTGGTDETVRLWEVETGKEVRQFEGSNSIQSAVLSPDSKYVLTIGYFDKTAHLWELETRKQVLQFEGHTGVIYSAAFSPDGRYVLTGSADRTALLWEAKTGKKVRQFDPKASWPVAFSPDGHHLLTGIELWETETGRRVRQYSNEEVDHDHSVSSAAISADSKYVLTGSDDGTVRLWDFETGNELRQLLGHSSDVNSVAFSPDGMYAVSGGNDCTTRLWDTSTGKEILSLLSFRDGTWVVLAPDGRFDTSNLEEIKGLHWVVPDEPMKPLPFEIFMRDYYEPRLLVRILSGERFKIVPSIATLNRVQPKVVIVAATPHKDHPDLATVTVKVSKAMGEFKQGDNKTTYETGVYDLRLFRDGQLVAQVPPFNLLTNDTSKQAGATPEQMRKAWREQARVKLGATGEQTITFNNIHLPRRPDLKQVEFAAYAFNEDRVKSQTDKKPLVVPEALAPRRGRAYVVTVGVNAYENRGWDLRFAASDARLAQQALCEGLNQSGEFADVSGVSLISDARPAAHAGPATKANIKAALVKIADQARPEDLVIVYYAGHGYADQSGNYFLFTSDTGPGQRKEITRELLRHSISSQELSIWLTHVDAGEIALIIDACHSAGTVKGEAGADFKPGPMGSRGLGQLAYDKGMQILAASQADDLAFEAAALEHGLLTYALMKDGIRDRKADLNKDGRITLSEALEYAVARVPMLYQAMRRGELDKLFESERDRGPQVVGKAASLRKKNAFQQPWLFDFARKRREIVLAR